jgi:hypothetical protein
MLVKDDRQVWNIKVHKDGKVIEEIDTQAFANKPGKDASQVYPFTYEID